ncbi:ATP-dependent DNA ligase [Candidatus Babeliales bacterium]|nr:ATP-dependent DNA ligase [Candidatus Babeliales bacterium]MBP9843545.1 ATP-dependent DNA ligase [Candidatus Babeliales bacterium]
MKFSCVAQLFQNIESSSGRLEKTKLLADALGIMSPDEAKMVTYLSLGDLYSSYQNIQFNIADKGLIEIIASLVGQTAAQVEQDYKVAGDLGTIVQAAWQGQDSGLSITQVYDHLVTTAEISGTGSTDLKLKSLVALLAQLDSFSVKYVIRIITKSLRLGFSDMTLIDAFSWMEVGNKSLQDPIEYAYNVCADIGLVIYTLKTQGIQAVERMTPQVGIPIRPAAAERLATAQEIIDKLGTCVAQPKLDGFRLQIHLDKTGPEPIVKFYSRNLIDMSNMFPDIATEIMKLPVQSLICEGEAIGFHEETQTYLQFQETVKRKRKHNIAQASDDIPLHVYLFDLLYFNGQSMLELRHTVRRDELANIVGMIQSPEVFLIDERKVSTGKELDDYFLENIGAGLEGLVVKKQDSVYQPGKRNFNWIKLKRRTGQKLGDTIDAVILGYYVGQGRRSSLGIGAFLVGIYNHELDCFESVAKVGTGLSDLDLLDLKIRCDNVAIAKPLNSVKVAKSLYPDVWMLPEIVCEIRADDITKSPLHTAGKTDSNLGYALRFPRFVKYRMDKSARDSTTSVELARLYEMQYQ